MPQHDGAAEKPGFSQGHHGACRQPGGGFNASLPSPLELVDDDRCARQDVRVCLKRDDLMHPQIPGNKWRKLKYNLIAAQEQGHARLLTFGGAYSSHIRATAAAGRLRGLDTVGVIRGEERLPLNETLGYAVSQGMQLTYLDRGAYRQKTSPAVLEPLLARYGRCYVIPEGGSNALAVRGCAELPAEITVGYDVLCCAVGTGGTLAGIAAGLHAAGTGRRALGFAALKGGQFLDEEVRRLQAGAGGPVTGNWSVEYGFHFGGYARRTAELDTFTGDFMSRHGVHLNWIYEAKMMFGLFALIAAGRFTPGTTIVAVLC
jgi:1-aminocyclopropane-1-carboxylate deaminase